MKRLFLILVVLAIAASIYFSRKPQTQPEPDERQLRLDYLRAHSLKTPLNPRLIPVHICYDADPPDAKGDFKGNWDASGTLVLSKSLKPSMVITAAHVFNVSYEKTYQCVCLDPSFIPQVFALSEVYPQSDQAGAVDVALAKVGPLQKVKGFSKFGGGRRNMQGKMSPLDKPYKARSLVTGEEVEVVGSYTDDGPGKESYFLLDFKHVAAESGTGFLTEDGQIIVLNGYSGVTFEILKILGRPSLKGLTFGTRMTLPDELK